MKRGDPWTGIFGMKVLTADEAAWPQLLEAARANGAVDVGATDRADHDIVIDEKQGIIFVNPARAPEILARLRKAVPESPRPPEAASLPPGEPTVRRKSTR